MTKKPKKWIAVLLGLFAPPLAMLYVAQGRWAGVYLVLMLAMGLVGVAYLDGTLALVVLHFAFIVVAALHAYRFAAGYPDDRPRPGYSRWFGLAGAAFGVFAAVFAIRAFVVEPFRFPSGSMLPTIPVGARLVVQKWGYGNYGSYGIRVWHAGVSAPLGRGDVIVFEYPVDRSIHYAKRLVGLPGDRVVYRGKRLSINGTPVPVRPAGGQAGPAGGGGSAAFVESLAETEYRVLVEDEAPAGIPSAREFPLRDRCSYDPEGVACEVPAGHVFVLGDNRDYSADSRMWGFVPADHIVGRVLRILP